MSQNGAIYAAKQGVSYRDILAFYYPNTTIKKLGAKPGGTAPPAAVSKPATAAGEAMAAWAERQVGQAYWYGTYGQLCTEILWNFKREQYPKYNQLKNTSAAMEHVSKGLHAFDCVGLIKGYLWDGTYAANDVPDTTANGMFKLCERKGAISTIPEEPGLLVWRSGHIGIYVGGGYAVEARGFNYGVVKTKLSERNWTNWAECPFLGRKPAPQEVSDTEPETIPPAYWRGTVKTKSSGYIELWRDSSKSKSVCVVRDGEWVNVLTGDDAGMQLANYGPYVGLVDTQYLVTREDIKREPTNPARPRSGHETNLVVAREAIRAIRVTLDTLEALMAEIGSEG
jgi:cell wall-associated NlpC family hydrolase